MDIDRVEDWKRFSQAMEKYIRDHTVEKYGIDNSVSGLDLMAITHSPLICVWQILKYYLRKKYFLGNKKNIIKDSGTQAAIIQGLRLPPPSFFVLVLSDKPPKIGSLNAL